MVKKLLITLAAILAAASAFAESPATTPGQIERRGLKLTPEQLSTITAVHPHLLQTTKEVQKSGQNGLAKLSASKKRNAMKANSSGSSIQGWRTVEQYSDNVRGWYELGIDGSEKLLWEYHDPNWVDDGWSDEPDFPFTAAFMRNGVAYGFHSELILYWLVWGHGAFTLDGDIIEYEEYGNDLSVTDFSSYVISCAYDEEADMVYAYTLNADASGYMFQSIDPDNWAFSVIDSNVAMENICPGLAYNPVDKRIYGMTTDSRFVTLNTKSGELDMVAKFNLDITTTLEGMTYSPLDKVFFFVYSDGWSDSKLYTIDPLNPKLEMMSDLPGTIQYRILVTPDVLVDPLAPNAPEIISIDFPEGARSGKAIVKMPSQTFDGNDITGKLAIIAKVDGEIAEQSDAYAGESVEIKFADLPEGLRKFSFIDKGNDLESAAVYKDYFVGYGTPTAPCNIELAEGLVSWEYSGTSTDGGYIDMENISFNVFVNGQKVNESPIKEYSCSFQMPDIDYQLYVAEVEAVNNGHTSSRGISNNIKYGNPLPLPLFMTPTEEQAQLISIYSESNPGLASWRFSHDIDGNACFNCYGNSYGSPSGAWLFMPPVYIPQSDMLIEIECEVMTYSSSASDNLHICSGENANVESMTTLASFDNINSEEWTKIKTWFYPGEGSEYIGFKTMLSDRTTDLYLRNIAIRVSNLPLTTPSEASNLTATAFPGGELKASVSFNMPEYSVDGSRLDDSVLTATVKTDAETKSVSGKPGSTQSVVISTIEGINNITVTVANNSDGLEASTSVFTGIDIPEPLKDLRISHTEDYRGLHLEWDAPQLGANGGYINPENVSYALCLYNSEEWEWEISEIIGNALSYDYYPQDANQIAFTQVGILTLNDKGYSETIRTAGASAGTPYTLPMEEMFENGYYNLEPIVAEQPDSTYTSSFGFSSDAYPYWIELPTPYGTGAFIVQESANCKARVVLPAFSTEGLTSASLEMPVYSGPDAAEIRVYASAYGMSDILLGSVADKEVTAFDKHRFALPNELMGKKWVEIKIDGIFSGEKDEIASFAQYKVKTFLKDDFSLNKVSVQPFAYIDDQVKVSVEVENVGTVGNILPNVELSFSKAGKIIDTVKAECVSEESTLAELETAVYEAIWTPTAEACGEIVMTAALKASDMDNSNNSMETSIAVDKGSLPVVTDLTATTSDNGVELSWTAPSIENDCESFENIPAYAFGDKLGKLKTVKNDDYESREFNFKFPYDTDAKAWQVIDVADMIQRIEEGEMTNEWFSAVSGNKIAMAATPYTVYVGDDMSSDRWLITPEIKGGSKVSFMLTSAVTASMEPVEFLYSSTDDSTESFVSLDMVKILTAGWKEYEYILPADARYFAVRYLGNTETSLFILLDDFRFEPVEECPVIVGYDVMRNGDILAENISSSGEWTDASPLDALTSYNVIPVVEKEGQTRRGLLSNTAYIGSTALKFTEAASAQISGKDGYIEIRNLIGSTVNAYSVDGKRVASMNPTNDIERIPVAKGAYMVIADSVRVKVLVK